MRQKIVAGNWKMNKNNQETQAFLKELVLKQPHTHTKIIVAPTFVNLETAVNATKNTPICVAAQNIHQAESGAYTGEISAEMIKAIGVNTVILGHSERRAYFGEQDSLLAQKVTTALKHHLTIIFCFGEELKNRQDQTHFQLVESQLKNALFHINPTQWKNIVLAYEPVWAIGTGETASPEQVQEMHAFIRKTIADAFGNQVAQDLSILYGGSVKPDNAKELFLNLDVDGGLIGGAALKTDDFLAIVQAL